MSMCPISDLIWKVWMNGETMAVHFLRLVGHYLVIFSFIGMIWKRVRNTCSGRQHGGQRVGLIHRGGAPHY